MSRPRLFFAAYSLLFLFTALMAVRRIYTLKTDFDGFWRAGRSVLLGRGPYDPTPGPAEDRVLFPSLRQGEPIRTDDPEGEGGGGTESAVKRYLPFFALLMVPFALLPMDVACLAWHVLSFASLFLGLKCAFRLSGRDRPLASVDALAVLAGTGIFWADAFTLGQIAVVTLALSIAAIDLARTRPWVGGALAGLAAAIKVTPGILGFYFLLKRRWAAAAASFAGFALCAAMCVPAWGLSRTVDLHRQWVEESRVTTGERFFAEQISIRYQNQSLHAWAARMFMEVNAGRGKKPFRVNVANLSPAAAVSLVRILQAPLALLCLFAIFARRPGEPLRLSEAGLLLAATTFISPIAWTFHLVVILPAVVCLWDRRTVRESRVWLVAVAVLELGIVHPWTRAVGFPMFACLAAALGAWRLAMLERRPAASPPA
jgi:hypothetical protein